MLKIDVQTVLITPIFNCLSAVGCDSSASHQMELTCITFHYQDGALSCVSVRACQLTLLLTVFLFNRPIFPELLQIRLLQIRPVPKSKFLETFTDWMPFLPNQQCQKC